MIFGIEKGILTQQVNCQNVMGAGLAKAIREKYPIVYDEYHAVCLRNRKEDLLGKVQIIKVEPELYIANIFGQFNYGNGKVNGKCYTDIPKLINAIDKIAKNYPDKTIYVPEGIGCGYAGGDWEEVYSKILKLNRENIIIWNTLKEKEVALSEDKEI